MKISSLLTSFLTLTLLVSYSGRAQTPQLGKNSVKEIIAAMTVEEKVNLVIGTGMNIPGIPLPPNMQGPVVGETMTSVPGAAGTTFPISRLGIPAFVVADGPAGLRIQPYRNGDSTASYYCTAFPIATLLASTWDVDLVEKVGQSMGNEVKEYGVDVILGPALNIHRNPLGGRNFEYFSEDPYVSGKMAAAMVRGIQSQGVGTSIKHFAANNHEWNRNSINIIASERALREIYLKGFEIAVKESNPWTVMSSYNKINGTYTSESQDLLTTILRKDWGYKGLVMTDWFGGKDAVAQMKAGNDLLMPGTAMQQKALLEAVKNNTLSMTDLDRNVENVLNLILKGPGYAHYQFTNKPNLKANALVARHAASEGMVLLTNQAALPVKVSQRLAAFGNNSYEMVTGGTGSGDVNEAYSISLLQGLEEAGFKVNKSLSDAYRQHISSEKAKRPRPMMAFMLPPPLPERTVSVDEIKSVVAETDVALITIGRNSGEFTDRGKDNDFYLSAGEKQLIKNVSEVYHAAGKKVAVILNIGGVIETVSWRNQVDAILLAWQPGQEAGYAIADVLSGKVNPSGKLATTFPIDLTDVPSSANFPGVVLEGPDSDNPSPLAGARAAEVIYEDGIWVGYRYFLTKNTKTSFPFGYGLSYTHFEYSNLKVSGATMKEKLTVSFTITNKGTVAGKEVAQVYVTAPGKTMAKPAQELKGFAKTKLLQPGESQTLSVIINATELASFDASRSAWVTEPGAYKLRVGSSAEQIQMTGEVKVTKETVVKVNKALAPAVTVKEIGIK